MMRNWIDRWVVVPLTALAVAGCGGGDAGERNGGEEQPATSAESETGPFRLGFLPSERGTEFSARADTLAAWLRERMGVEVEVLIPTAYEPLIEALRFGNLDAAFLDAAPAWMAQQRAGTRVVLAEVREGGDTHYWATAWTRTENDFDGLEDLVGKRTAHTSWTGSSGFILPIGTMVRQGLIRPAGDEFPQLQAALQETFASYAMTGGYKAAMELLARGQVDAAFGADDAAERFLEPADRERVKPFLRIGRVPSHVLVVRPGLSEARRQAFVDAMLQLTRERPEVYRALYGVEGVVPADDGHLAEFGSALEALPALHTQITAPR